VALLAVAALALDEAALKEINVTPEVARLLVLAGKTLRVILHIPGQVIEALAGKTLLVTLHIPDGVGVAEVVVAALLAPHEAGLPALLVEGKQVLLANGPARHALERPLLVAVIEVLLVANLEALMMPVQSHLENWVLTFLFLIFI